MLYIASNYSIIFQQDNANIHSSKVTRNYFKYKNINVFDWPSKPLDSNPVKNIFHISNIKNMEKINNSNFQFFMGKASGLVENFLFATFPRII